MVVSTIYAFCTLTCDVRRRYAMDLAEILRCKVSLQQLFRSICRIAVYSLQMASKIVLKVLWINILTYLEILEVLERPME